jgi:hypothetical protein
LASQTFLVAYSFSIADIAVWSNIAGEFLPILIGVHLNFQNHISLNWEVTLIFVRNWPTMGKPEKVQEISKPCLLVQQHSYASTLDEVVSAYVGK